MEKVLLLFVLFAFSSPIFSQVHWESIILASNQWRYLPATSQPAANWNTSTFDDSSWPIGPGGIGYGDGDDATEIDPVKSLYLRIKFQVADKSIIDRLLLDIDYDDAFVAYLNGAEICRSPNITDDPPLFNSNVNWLHEATMYSGGLPERYEVQLSNLIDGENILALQIVNESINSSDLTSIVFLNARIDYPSILYYETPDWFVAPVEMGESNLPLLFINTFGQVIVDEPKITASLGIIDNAEGVNSVDDPFTFFVDYIGIEIRGSSSQMFEKKSYGFETRTETGENLNVSLLGMPSENDWVLHGPYSDKSLMRNALTYHLGSKTGRWAPRTRFCELFINNDYRGVYLLLEKIKRDNNRVDIAKLEPHEISGEDLTGGYILSIDRPESHYWISPYKGINGYSDIVINYIYPKPETMPTQQKQYIRDYVTSFENALHGSNYLDPNVGYRAYTDVSSFVDYYLINELSRNVDAYRLSTFFYKDKGDKLTMGPIWDYNLAFGNANYYQGYSTQGWVIQGVEYGDGFQIPFWWDKLRTDNYFNARIKERWFELRQGDFSKDSIISYINSVSSLLSEASQRNFSQFPVLGQWVWPNYFVGQTYQEELDYMKDWILQRIDWMDQQISLISDIEAVNIANAYETYAFPNPFYEKLTIRTSLYSSSTVEVSISNILGQLLYSSSYQNVYGTIDLIIPDEVFRGNVGVYIYEVKVEGKRITTGKVIKAK
jgi:hypothetical protein